MTEDNSFSAPKSTRQIRDKLYNERKKSKPETAPRINIADDVITILSQINTNPFVHEVVLTKDKKPVVIIYSDKQMQDMKRNCLGENGSVMGVDRTFNLGKFYVTAFSYKNRCVVRTRTDDHPVMLGPCMIQFDAEEGTYGKFFSHISDRMGTTKLTIGSDEEKSMTNALKSKFPNATFLLCTKHIQDIRRHLENIGVSLGDRNKIQKIIFGKEDGIVFAPDDIDFDARCENLQTHFDNHAKFQTYWERNMKEKLYKFVYLSLRNQYIDKLWTNKNSESINQCMKTEVNWEKISFLS